MSPRKRVQDQPADKLKELLFDCVTQLTEHRQLLGEMFDIVRTPADRLAILSHRYLLLSKGSPPVSLYPEDIATHVLQAITCEKLALGESIHKTIDECLNSYSTLGQKHSAFIACTLRLKYDEDNAVAVICGSETTKPLAYFVESLHDILFQLHIIQTNIKYRSYLFNLEEPESIDKFHRELTMPADLDKRIKSLRTYCRYSIEPIQ